MPALATLADLKSYLSIANTNADTELTRLLNASSALAEQLLCRNVFAGDRTERRHGNGRDMIQLRDAPILSVSSLTVSGSAVALSDGTSPGYLFADNALYLIGLCFTRGRYNVVVTYSAGYASIPPDLAHAVIEIAAQAYKERDWIGHQSKSLGGETVAFLRSAVPESARAVIATYARTYTID